MATKDELKDLAREADLPVSGTKDELAHRLEDAGVDAPKAAPAGYVYVTREVTTVEDEDGTVRPLGYTRVGIDEDKRHLVDAKSVPELEVLGYRVVD